MRCSQSATHASLCYSRAIDTTERNRRAVILFSGDPQREERRKGLPRRLLSTLHTELKCVVARTPGVDLIEAYEVRARFEFSSGRGTFTLGSHETLATKIDLSLRTAFDSGYDSVILLAGDIAGLRTEVLEDAFAALASGGAVLGPSADGGFYLAGFHGHVDVDWSTLPLQTTSALSSLEGALTALHIPWTLAPRLDDIDSRMDAEVAAQQLRLTPLGTLLLTLLTQTSPHTTPFRSHAVAVRSSVPARAPPSH